MESNSRTTAMSALEQLRVELTGQVAEHETAAKAARAELKTVEDALRRFNGAGTSRRKGDMSAKVLDAVGAEPGRSWSIMDIKTATGIDDLTNVLGTLTTKGKLVRVGRGTYQAPQAVS